jgi:hypothetical protein
MRNQSVRVTFDWMMPLITVTRRAMLPGKVFRPEDVLRIARKRAWLILVPWALIAASTAVVARKLPDTYRSSALIQGDAASRAWQHRANVHDGQAAGTPAGAPANHLEPHAPRRPDPRVSISTRTTGATAQSCRIWWSG